MSNIENTLSGLDVDMGSVEDLKGFELPPEGSYSCLLSLTTKEIAEETKLLWEFKIVEPLQLNDPDAVVAPDAAFSLFMGLKPIVTKTGSTFDPRSMFKVKCTILSEALGVANTLSALHETVQNIQVNCMLKYKRTKDGKIFAEVPDAGFAVA